jgi:hypothetical protein
MSRVKRRPVSLFYARVFIDMGEDHPLGDASGSVCIVVVLWVESRAAVRATPVHEPWALAASNFESRWDWVPTERRFVGEMDAGEEHSTWALALRVWN